MNLHLRNGSRIGIVGGGPAGSFFALAALRFAREAGLDLQVTIYEPRDFAQPGPKGCNMCAGIIPGFVLQEMQGLGLDVPSRIVQSPIDSSIHVFLPRAAGLAFGTLVPKGAFANLSLLGKDLGPRSVGQFLGRLLFAVTGLLRRDGPFARAYLDTIAREQERPVVQRTLSRILWGMFTGSDSYPGLTGMLFRPKVGYPLCSRLLLRLVGRQAL